MSGCSGRSSIGPDGLPGPGNYACPRPVRYRVVVGSLTREACGTHIGWVLGRMLVPGRKAEVEQL